MKTTPILFSTDMVQAILDGRKPQTRRIYKLPQECDHSKFMEADWKNDPSEFNSDKDSPEYWYCSLCGNGISERNNFKGIKCPYGKPGDILWVRETFRKYYRGEDNDVLDFDNEIIEFAADNPEPVYLSDGDGFIEFNKDGSEKMIPWKPSIFMPKAACRIFLKITNVRVERIQDISEEDAIAEGIYSFTKDGQLYKYWYNSKGDVITWRDMPRTAVEAYKMLWIQINGSDSWEANPFVWVVEFEQCGKPEGFN